MPRLPVSPFSLPVAAAAISLGTTAPAFAATSEDEQAWINITATGPLTGEVIYFAELQPRFGDGPSRLDQLLLRGAVGVKLSQAVSFYQGYAHVVVPVDGGRDINEERSFQQLSANLGKPLSIELSSRTRLEQRWRSDGNGTGWRLRQMARLETPLRADSDAVNALVWSEAFIALNSTDWGARAGFDQLRTFAGLELGLAGASTIEAGYLNQIIDRPAGQTQVNHVASLTLFFRH